MIKLGKIMDHRGSILLLFYMWILSTTCLSGGGVFPLGTILSNVGDDINITCTIDLNNSEGKNSSNLWFYDGSERVPLENIAIVNSSSIVLMIKNATEMEKRYTCKEDGKYGIDVNRVIIGTPPKNVTDFQCKSYDFEYFKCTFTPPHNYVIVTYNLSYIIQSQIYDCPLSRENNSQFFCTMSMDNNTYRQVHEFYNFKLVGSNPLGENAQIFDINHFDSVIPAKPQLNFINTTSSSVTYEWQILNTLYASAKKGWEYDIRIMPLIDNKTWITVDMSSITKINPKTYRLEINDLQYAYTWYDIRMKMKVKTAKNDGTMWSETFNTTFRTESKKPDSPPRTDVGSFYIDVAENLHLYWEILPRYKENGPNLHYEITEIRKDGKIVNNIKPYEISLLSATFKKLPPANYEFYIKSVNSMGMSDSSSVILVPKERYSHPEWLRKVYHQQKYNLSWSAPKNRKDLIDYTVFWCTSKKESSNECEGTINFKHVGKNTSFTPEEKGNSTMNFAVSANYLTSSSGMIWAMCTALKNSDFGKMKPMLTLSGKTTITVQWSLECLYTTILEGYELIYCPISKPDIPDPNCTESERNVTISKNARQYNLTNLKPYTTYKVIMSMYSAEKHGPPSDPVVLTTVETAPSPPRLLDFRNITNNSVILTWTAPEHLNGKLRKYDIIYNNDHFPVEEEELLNSKEITYKLVKLRSFYDYKVYVKALTVDESDPSNDIHFKTLVGVPGPIGIGKVQTFSIDSDVIFKWDPPEVPSGRLDFYEVRSVFLKNNDIIIDKISTVNGTRCKLKLPPCPDNTHLYKFYVRGVNVGEKENYDESSYIRNKRESYINTEETIFNNINYDIELPTFEQSTIDSKPYENHRVRHNHQEKENLRLQKEHVSQNVHITNQNAALETVDESLNFMCEEDNDPRLKKWIEIQRKDGRTFLKPEWSSLPSYVCNYNKTDVKRKVILVGGVLLSSLIMIAATYFGCKKYRKMKNIAIRFPPGLTDLDQDVRPKCGVDNIIGKHDITRSEESLFKNENHYLLASSGNDSGYLHGIDCSDKSDAYDLSTSDHVRDDEQSSNEVQSDTVEISDVTDNSSNASLTQSPNVNVRGNKSTAIHYNHQNYQSSPAITATDAIITNGPLVINGYVQHQPFQRPKPEQSLNGYTTLDAFGKPIIPSTTTHNLSSIATVADNESKHKDMNNELSENICGYVTHKQLSEFGSRLQ